MNVDFPASANWRGVMVKFFMVENNNIGQTESKLICAILCYNYYIIRYDRMALELTPSEALASLRTDILSEIR